MLINIKDIKCKIVNNGFAKRFMKKKHYTKSCAKATISYAFYIESEEKDILCGMIVYGQPSGKHLASSIWEGGNEKECLELLRMFTYDWCPKNTESYCISQSIKRLKKDKPEIKVLVSYADCSAGHIGYIYQASNWLYTGQGSLERKFFIDGVRQHRRNLYDIYGTSSIKKLKELLGDRFTVGEDRVGKNRYIFIIRHNKKEYKYIMDNLKVDILPYPKGDISYYNKNNSKFNEM